MLIKLYQTFYILSSVFRIANLSLLFSVVEISLETLLFGSGLTLSENGLIVNANGVVCHEIAAHRLVQSNLMFFLIWFVQKTGQSLYERTANSEYLEPKFKLILQNIEPNLLLAVPTFALWGAIAATLLGGRLVTAIDAAPFVVLAAATLVFVFSYPPWLIFSWGLLFGLMGLAFLLGKTAKSCAQKTNP